MLKINQIPDKPRSIEIEENGDLETKAAVFYADSLGDIVIIFRPSSNIRAFDSHFSELFINGSSVSSAAKAVEILNEFIGLGGFNSGGDNPSTPHEYNATLSAVTANQEYIFDINFSEVKDVFDLELGIIQPESWVFGNGYPVPTLKSVDTLDINNEMYINTLVPGYPYGELYMFMFNGYILTVNGKIPNYMDFYMKYDFEFDNPDIVSLDGRLVWWSLDIQPMAIVPNNIGSTTLTITDNESGKKGKIYITVKDNS